MIASAFACRVPEILVERLAIQPAIGVEARPIEKTCLARRTRLSNGIFPAAIAIAAALAPAIGSAQETGSWLVRTRAVHLDSVNKDHTDLGANLRINNKWLPELDVSYFFTPNIAAELVLTYPQRQTVYSNGTDIGRFKHLPPTLTAQYHFTELPGFRPYLGVGVNYTNISSVKVLDGAANLKRSSFGLAAQVGVDVPLTNGWLLNLDVKKVQIKTDVRVGGTNHGSFKLDPVLVGIGVGRRF